MGRHAAPRATLRAAETVLLDAQQRGDVAVVAALLAEDFEEADCSARRHARAVVPSAPGTTEPDPIGLADCSRRLPAADLAPVNFGMRLQRDDRMPHSAHGSL